MTEVKKTTIRPDTANMTKTPGGNFHKPDYIGNALAGLTVVQVLAIAVAVGLNADKYSHLNPGQQRMTLGNSLRKLTNIVEVPLIDGKPDQKTVDLNEAAYAVRTTVEDMAEAAREANEAAKQAKANEKAALAESKKAAKDAAAKAKTEAKATESEGGEA